MTDEPPNDARKVVAGHIPGTECWVTRDYGREGKSLCMSKATLGEFVFHLMRLGGSISSTYAMAPQYPRSYVQMAITLPAGCAADLEAASGVALECPRELKLA
jgi:hypothetical protein